MIVAISIGIENDNPSVRMLFWKIKLQCLIVRYIATNENNMFDKSIPINLPVTPASRLAIKYMEIKKVVSCLKKLNMTKLIAILFSLNITNGKINRNSKRRLDIIRIKYGLNETLLFRFSSMYGKKISSAAIKIRL